jgi:hypothetical protein
MQVTVGSMWNGFVRVDEESSSAAARGAVIEECIYRLDEPSDGR